MKTETRTGDISEVVIDARADLMVGGHDKDEVTAVTDSDDQLTVTQNDSRVVIVSLGDCTVHVPAWAQLFIERANGDCSIRSITSGVKIRAVGGDLSVIDCDEVSVDSVGGDFNSSDLKGQLQVRAVGGDLNASEAHFSGASLNVGGDATLGLEMDEGQSASINAGGDVKVELLGEANARVSIMDSNGRRRQVFGAGSANINVRCGGEAVVVAEDGDASEGEERQQGGFGFNSGEFEATMGEFERNLAEMERNIEQMAKQFSERFSNIGAGVNMDMKLQKAQLKAEAAARKAEANMQRHAAKIEEHARRQAERAARHAERAARHAERAARRGEYGFTDAPQRPATPPAPVQPFAPPPQRSVTDEERMVILRMLQEKKITSEQADQLLAALG